MATVVEDQGGSARAHAGTPALTAIKVGPGQPGDSGDRIASSTSDRSRSACPKACWTMSVMAPRPMSSHDGGSAWIPRHAEGSAGLGIGEQVRCRTRDSEVGVTACDDIFRVEMLARLARAMGISLRLAAPGFDAVELGGAA